jgi:hypothetical protein
MSAIHVDIGPVVHTRTVAGIEALFDPHVHLVVWERPDTDIEACTVHWPVTTGRLMRPIRCRDLGVENVAETLSLPPAAPLAADVLLLCDVFATLTGADTLGLRVDITEQATCPRFHADRVTLRLMTTYRGPATQWLQDDRPHQARAGDVLFAKGDLWPDLRCGPCVHRSPQPEAGQTRVLLTVDAL